MLVLGFATMVQAQVRGPGWNRRNTPTPETVTVSGTMVVVRGMPALKSGDVTYYVSGSSPLLGFIDGFKEGAQVTFEGVVTSSSSDRNVKYLSPSKLTINGRVYELASPAPALPALPPALPSNPGTPSPGTPRLYQYRLPGPMGPMGPMMPSTPSPRRR
jgi:hypothetical protein